MTLTQITEKGIKDGEIVNADINANAAIAKSKLASLDIVNGDINSSAAIAGSKISPNFGSQDIVTTSSLSISVGSSGTNASAGFNELTIEGGNEDIGMCFISPAANERTHTIAFGDSNNNNAGKIEYNHSTDDLTLTASDNIILTGDKVGIGTITPNNKLDVNGGIVCSPNTDGKDTFELSTHAADEGRLKIKNVDTTTIQLRAGGVSYLNGGNIGFGTTSPSTLLHLERSSTTAYSTTSTTDDPTLYIVNSGAGGQSTIHLQTLSGGTANTGQATISSFCETASSKNTALTFATRDNSGNPPREKLRITSEKKLILGLNDSIPATMEVRYSTVPTYLTSTYDGAYGEATLSVNAPRTAQGSGSWGTAGNSGYGIGAIQVLSHSSNGSRVKILTSDQDNTAPTDKLTIKEGGNVEITDGNLELASGHGINFHNYGSGTNISSNLLDDYEEGTFTVTFKYWTGSDWVNATFDAGPSHTTANYTKIGNLVFFAYYSGGFNINTGAGSPAGIDGLPFQCEGMWTAFPITHADCFDADAENGAVNANSTLLRFFAEDSAGNANWKTSSGHIMVAGTYRTTA